MPSGATTCSMLKKDHQSEELHSSEQLSKGTKKEANKFAGFLKKQQEFEKKKKEKLTKKREEQRKQSESAALFKPSLCKKSRKLLNESRSSESVFENLSKARTPPVELDTFYPFSPATNESERKTKLSKPVYEHLYEISKQETKSESLSSKVITINKSSEQFLIQRFSQEFNLIYSKYAEERGLCYSFFVVLLKEMNFVNEQSQRFLLIQAWNSLVQDSLFIEKDCFLNFLLAVMNYIPSKNHHKKYFEWYQNRYNFARSPRNSNFEEFTFQPTLSSRVKSKSNRDKDSSVDYWMKEKQLLQEKWVKMRMEREKHESEGLTFIPKINKKELRTGRESVENMWKGLRNGDRNDTHRALSLYSESMRMQANAREMAEEARRDEIYDDMKGCTFSPKIINHFDKNKKPNCEVKGMEKTVNRLKKGYQERLNQKNYIERTKPELCSFRFDIERKSNQTHDLLLKDKDKIKAKNSNLNDDESSDDEATEVCVKLPNGNVEKIIILSNQDKSLVIDEFIIKHSLSGELAKYLKQSI